MDITWQQVPGIWFQEKPTLGFIALIPPGAVAIELAAASVYRLRVDGKVVAYGPARAAHGFARTDRIPLTARPGAVVSVEVVRYATGNFYYPAQPPFLKAAFFDNADRILGYTGDHKTFRTFLLPFRDWNVAKLTLQRDLLEKYTFTQNANWFAESSPSLEEVESEPITTLPQILPRRAPLPSLTAIRACRLLFTAGLDSSAADIAEPIPGKILNACRIGGAGERYQLYDFGKLYAGFIILELSTTENCELLIGWDEVLVKGAYDSGRSYWANNFIRLSLTAGQNMRFESFEPYALRCLAVAVLQGKVTIKRVELREYAFDSANFQRQTPPAGLTGREASLYSAACETFRQNTVDVFMDCPGRERAAWLCDSYFMAQAEFFLTGRTDVEDDFLENFLLADSSSLPADWMLPMCYPADNPRKTFLPQWAFWLFLEVFEKNKERNGEDFTQQIRPRLLKFLHGCEQYLNAEGLLESLPGWNFIEWSDANHYFDGVHFPTNMLYARCLEDAGECYSDTFLLERAATLKQKIISLSFDGKWFHDNATWNSGILKRSGNISEICQYYADFCHIAETGSREFDRWRDHLLTETAFTGLVPAAIFIGKILRFRSLISAGRNEQFKREAVNCLRHMVEQTGTLWEKAEPTASCSHGFASVVAYYLWLARKTPATNQKDGTAKSPADGWRNPVYGADAIAMLPSTTRLF